MARRGSLPWLILAAVLAIATAVFLVSALFNPFAEAFMGLDSWQNTGLSYTNEGQRMVGDFATFLLPTFVFAIAVGFLIEARRAV